MKTYINSFPIGTNGWRNTLLGQVLHIGEYLKDKTPDEEHLRGWGQTVFDNTSDLIEYFNGFNKNKTVIHFEEESINTLIKQAFRYELTDEEIKDALLSFLRSYRWHVIEKSKSIAGLAIQETNQENRI